MRRLWMAGLAVVVGVAGLAVLPPSVGGDVAAAWVPPAYVTVGSGTGSGGSGSFGISDVALAADADCEFQAAGTFIGGPAPGNNGLAGARLVNGVGTSIEYNELLFSTGSTVTIGSHWTSMNRSDGPFGAQITPVVGQITVLSAEIWVRPKNGSTNCAVYNQMVLDASEMFGSNASMRGQCPCQGVAGDPVDTRTGNLHFPLPGVGVAGRGPGLDFRMGYNSLDGDYDGPVGHGWRHSYDMQMVLNADGSRTVVQETGATVTFVFDGSDWVPAARMNASLVEAPADTWTFERGYFSSFVFDAGGVLTSIADRNGYETTLTYDGTGQLDYVEDEAGRRLTFGWSGGRVSSITDPYTGTGGPRTIGFTYDTNGDLTGYDDIGDGSWVLGYDGSHRLLTIRTPKHTDPTKVVENHYDASGRVDWQEDALNRRITFIYEDHPTLGVAGATLIEDAEGDVRADWYDNQGRRWKVTEGYGTAAETSTTYEYDPLTFMVSEVIDGDGQSWSYDYDRWFPSSVTDPLGRETATTYNAFGQPLTVTDAEDITTEFTYDVNGNPLTVTMADGVTGSESTTAYHYDAVVPVFAGDVTSMTDGRGKNWSYEYDEDTGYLEVATDPEGNISTTQYNNLGWVESSTAPLGNASGATPEDYRTHFTYNDYGDVLTVTNPEDEVSTYFYDPNRNVTRMIDNDGEETRTAYTDADEVAGVTTGFGTAAASTIEYEYFDDGQRELWRDGNDNAWSYTYDAVGRLSSETDPNSNTTAYTYDGRGLLESITQPGGNCATPTGCVTYGYDNAGQLTTIDYSEDSPSDVTTIIYDNVGRRESLIRADGQDWAWAWTARGQLKSYTNEVDETVSYTWDANGNLDTIDYPTSSGGLVDYDYDDASRMIEVTDWLSNTTAFDWDENSRLDEIDFPTGTGAGNIDEFGYDNANRLASIDYLNDTTTVASIDYDRTDGDGLITDAATTGLPAGPEAFGYDARDQLTTLNTIASYEYDLAGSLTELPDGRLQVFDPAQQLCWSSPTATSGSCSTPPGDATTFDHDDRGNRVAMSEPDGTDSEYQYDQANRLTSADVADSTGDQYHAITPVTVLNTAPASQTGACPTSTGQCLTLNATNGRTRTVQVAGQAGLPAAGEIDAVMINITASNTDASPTGTSNAVLSIYPADVSWPYSYTLGYQTGDLITNSLITRVDANGQIRILTDGDTDVSIAVHGYFSPPDLGSDASQYVALNAANVFNYQNGDGDCIPSPCGPLDSTTPSYDVKILGEGGVPDDADVTAVAVSLNVNGPSGTGAILAGPSGGTYGVGLIFEANQLTANFAIIPIGDDGRIDVGLYGTDADLTINVHGYFTGDPEANEGGLHLLETPQVLVKTDGTPIGNCIGLADCGTAPPSGATRTIQVTGEAGLPNEAIDAIVVNITITNPASSGFLIAWPDDGDPAPPLATALYDASTITGTSAIIPVGTNGRINVLTGFSLEDYRIDVQGYMSSSDTVTFDYDAGGLRTSKSSIHNGTSHYTWDQSGGLPMLLTETNDDNTTHIIYGPTGPLTEIVHDGTSTTSYWYHTDLLGSTRLATDNSGDTIGTYTYDPYGALADRTGSHTPTLTYAGEYKDLETGLIYLRARHYDPATGQFISRDPLLAISGSAHGYANGNPVNTTDPTGLLFGLDDVGDAVGGALSAGGSFVGDAVAKATPDCFTWQENCESIISDATNGAICAQQWDEGCGALATLSARGCAFVGCVEASYDGSRLDARGGVGLAVGVGADVSPGTAPCDRREMELFGNTPFGGLRLTSELYSGEYEGGVSLGLPLIRDRAFEFGGGWVAWF